MQQKLTLMVNGQVHHLEVEPETPLIYVLRNDLGLKGTKMACGLEQCGACMVIVDGEAIPSCRVPIRSLQGRQITTIEGIGSEGEMHPLQQAFLEEQALQCGFCTTGILISAKALLDRNPNPTEAEIKQALGKNLCRCGMNHRVIKAIQRAAGQVAGSPTYEVEKEEGAGLSPEKADVVLPGSLVQDPDLDAWIRIDPEDTVTIFTGKVDYGQGIRTSFAQIAADELDVCVDRVKVVMADTDRTPNEGMTAGSMSMQVSGNSIRYAAAEAKQHLLSVAYEALEAPLERLVVEDGTILDPVSGRRTTYWEVMGGQKFGRQVTGVVQPKKSKDYFHVGQPVQGVNMFAKVTGNYTYIHDLDLPEMVHGRVLRPPHYHARLVQADEENVSRLPGVIKVVRDGSFIGVIAEREEQAIAAARALHDSLVWERGGAFPSQDSFYQNMLGAADQAFLVVEGTAGRDPIPPITVPGDAQITLSATYKRPYHMHASLAPSAAVAKVDGDKMTLWVHSQGVFPQRKAIANVLGIPEQDLRVLFVEGPGCYGQNGADDAALDAALLARVLPGRPVMLKWERNDEHKWEPYSSAMVMQMQASLDEGKNVIDWNHDVWSYTHIGRRFYSDKESALVGSWYLEEPFEKPTSMPILGNNVGIHRNADPLYSFPNRRIVKHFLPDSPLRVSNMRGLGAYGNIFALESFMDELAHAAGLDPLDFRLRNLNDDRAKAVLHAAAEKAGWSEESSLQEGMGQGLAFAQYKNNATYTAVIVELEVGRSSGQIQLRRVVIAADSGQIVNPDSLSSQLEGSFLQAASWTLKEQVGFDSEGIYTTDWYSYPILRFQDVPKIETVLLNRPDMPYLGSGEACQGPAAAAIANAVFDAVGIRLREIPFTPAKVLAALGGVG
jgi:nicotinate dehydrogenase subunit B